MRRYTLLRPDVDSEVKCLLRDGFGDIGDLAVLDCLITVLGEKGWDAVFVGPGGREWSLSMAEHLRNNIGFDMRFS